MKRKEAKVEMMLMEMATGRRTEPELGAGGREDSDLIFDIWVGDKKNDKYQVWVDSDQGKSTLQ